MARKPGAAFQRGQVVASRYTVLDIIGRGGMGCIYKVRDNTLDEDVALKTLLPKFTNDQHVVDRFFNEARIARQLSHPNIIRVHDIGMAGSVVYISMELLRGRSLRDWLDSIPEGKHMPIAYALRVLIQLCAALEFAHRFTVHRDIKPENIMITPQGQVKLMDFGISKLKSSVNLTSAQMVMGTPKYMSPEQLKDSSKVDARSDIYALGAVLYELLTGNVPAGLARQPSHVRSETPPSLDAVVEKCLALDPKDRYQSVGALREELQRLLDAVERNAGIEVADFNLPPVPAVSEGGLLRKIAGVVLMVLVLAAAGFSAWRLEVMASRQQDAADTNAHAPPPVDYFAQAFGELELRVMRARETALSSSEVQAAANAENETGNETAKHNATAYFAEGDAFWERAQAVAAERNPDAFEYGWRALECFLGPVICPEGMVFVPPGETVVERGTDPVFVDGFFMDRYEVTNAQFRAFALEAPAGWRLPDYLAGDGFDEAFLASPVVGVTFYDALAYAAFTAPSAWAKRTLPTEAQWARAAYGGPRAPQPYPWGREWDPSAFSTAGENDGFAGPAPVGSFEADRSPFGCYDVAGNVMEWTRSVFVTPYDHAEAAAPLEEIWFGTPLAVRGGSYADREVTLTERRSALFDEASPVLGFRCALPFPGTLDAVDELLP